MPSDCCCPGHRTPEDRSDDGAPCTRGTDSTQSLQQRPTSHEPPPPLPYNRQHAERVWWVSPSCPDDAAAPSAASASQRALQPILHRLSCRGRARNAGGSPAASPQVGDSAATSVARARSVAAPPPPPPSRRIRAPTPHEGRCRDAVVVAARPAYAAGRSRCVGLVHTRAADGKGDVHMGAAAATAAVAARACSVGARATRVMGGSGAGCGCGCGRGARCDSVANVVCGSAPPSTALAVRRASDGVADDAVGVASSLPLVSSSSPSSLPLPPPLQHDTDDDEEASRTAAVAIAASAAAAAATTTTTTTTTVMPTTPHQTAAPPSPWTYTPPPNNQRTFYFAEDQLAFSSAFDSGNLLHVERVGAWRYHVYTAMDCGNGPTQTNNRQWFHFCVRGGCKGAVVSVTIVGLIYAAMYTYDWMPVAAVPPWQPQYVRLPGKASVVSLEAMPATPGYPAHVYKPPAPVSPSSPSPPYTTAVGARADADGANTEDGGRGGGGRDDEDDEDDEDNDRARRSSRGVRGAGDKARRSSSSSTSKTPGAAATVAVGAAATATSSLPLRGKKRDVAMSVSFDFRLDYALPLPCDAATTAMTATSEVCGDAAGDGAPAMYIASNHPYSYATLQRALRVWQARATYCGGGSSSSSSSSSSISSRPHRAASGSDEHRAVGVDEERDSLALHRICYYHEVLCISLDGRHVDMLTITDAAGMLAGTRAPMLVEGTTTTTTTASATTATTTTTTTTTTTAARTTAAGGEEGDGDEAVSLPHSGPHARPPCFVNKSYVVLTSRVHAGECAGSHTMHGVVDFLLDPADARARALRRRYVFVLVPMLNPDGVVRGHSRVDAAGVDLNRAYRSPSPRRHAAPYAVRALLRALHTTNNNNHGNNNGNGNVGGGAGATSSRVALYIDMHAHANKRGTFLYGNSMPAEALVQSLVYAKLVALHTPYFDVTSSSFTQANMYGSARASAATTLRSKDSSSRVAMYLDAGLAPHCYVMEASHVAGRVGVGAGAGAGAGGGGGRSSVCVAMTSAEASASVATVGSGGGTAAAATVPTTAAAAMAVGSGGASDAGVLVRGGAVMYSPATFADTGRALLLALYDLGITATGAGEGGGGDKGNDGSGAGGSDTPTPSRALLLSPYGSLTGLSTWVRRQMQLETAERRFVQAYKQYYSSATSVAAATATTATAATSGTTTTNTAAAALAASSVSTLLSRYRRYVLEHGGGGGRGGGDAAVISAYVADLAAVLSSMPDDAIEETVTLRRSRTLPPLTYTDARSFVPPVVALALLVQSPATSAPRSLFANASSHHHHHHHHPQRDGGGGGVWPSPPRQPLQPQQGGCPARHARASSVAAPTSVRTLRHASEPPTQSPLSVTALSLPNAASRRPSLGATTTTAETTLAQLHGSTAHSHA